MEECPYCDWTGKSLKRHLNYCSENPENKKVQDGLFVHAGDLKTLYSVLNRWIKQNPGKRSTDFKRECIPLRDQYEDFLIKNGKIAKKGAK